MIYLLAENQKTWNFSKKKVWNLTCIPATSEPSDDAMGVGFVRTRGRRNDTLLTGHYVPKNLNIFETKEVMKLKGSIIWKLKKRKSYLSCSSSEYHESLISHWMHSSADAKTLIFINKMKISLNLLCQTLIKDDFLFLFRRNNQFYHLLQIFIKKTTVLYSSFKYISKFPLVASFWVLLCIVMRRQFYCF